MTMSRYHQFQQTPNMLLPSMTISNDSKTPYTDATQVRKYIILLSTAQSRQVSLGSQQKASRTLDPKFKQVRKNDSEIA